MAKQRSNTGRSPGDPVLKARSLHIGVNEVDGSHYAGWTGPLKLCENDANLMRSLAVELGFKTKILKTRKATRDNVAAAIRKSAEKLKTGDLFLISYAGHGGQVEDFNNDEDDSQDETWCLYDGQLLDDELAMLWSEFEPGVRIVMVSDSCNSGSIAKEVHIPEDPVEREAVLATLAPHDAVDRAMPARAARTTFRHNKSWYEEIQMAMPSPMPRIRASLRQFSGCRDGEKSYDGQNGNGILTEAVNRVFNHGKFDGDYNAFFEAIHDRMPKWQKPVMMVIGEANQEFDRQKPLQI